jgi:hypothetical protein
MFEKIDYDELVSKYDNETKLDIAAWVISKIDEHGKDPGSFRYLIYDRLGFDLDAYVPLYLAGGMNITNELDYSYRENIAEVVKKQNLDNKELKSALLICDEPGCYNYANCGFPTSDGGYRRTCHDHSHFKTNKPET